MEKIVIKKEPDDPLCTRVSAGGFPGVGYYLTYRGDEDEVIRILRLLLEALEKKQHPRINESVKILQ